MSAAIECDGGDQSRHVGSTPNQLGRDGSAGGLSYFRANLSHSSASPSQASLSTMLTLASAFLRDASAYFRYCSASAMRTQPRLTGRCSLRASVTCTSLFNAANIESEVPSLRLCNGGCIWMLPRRSRLAKQGRKEGESPPSGRAGIRPQGNAVCSSGDRKKWPRKKPPRYATRGARFEGHSKEGAPGRP